MRLTLFMRFPFCFLSIDANNLLIKITVSSLKYTCKYTCHYFIEMGAHFVTHLVYPQFLQNLHLRLHCLISSEKKTFKPDVLAAIFSSSSICLLSESSIQKWIFFQFIKTVSIFLMLIIILH